jgi:hypothetical protein
VRLIKVEYTEDIPKKTEAAAGSARGAQVAPVRERSVTVTITGLMNTVGTREVTSKWIEENFADKLSASALSAPVAQGKKAATVSVEYTTNNFWNEGEKPEVPAGSQYTVFKISWQINPDSEYVPGNE